MKFGDSAGGCFRYNAIQMKYVLVFFILVSALLWLERMYYKRKAELLESRLYGRGPEHSVTGLFDAWLDGRIEARLQKEKNKNR